MKALVYHGPHRRSWTEVPKPVIQAETDAVVRVDAGSGALKVCLTRS